MTFRDTTFCAMALCLAFLVAGCGSNEIAPEDMNSLQPKVEPFFNSTGTRGENPRDLKPDEFLIEGIDAADNTLEVAAYGFYKENIIDAIIRAYDRGVDVRFVGSSNHFDSDGYQRLHERRIPMQVGNQYAIMHDKFFVIDGRFVFVGTGNITSTGFDRNNNNWVWIESIPLAEDFQAEFDQMFNGRFSDAKSAEHNGNTYQVGDTEVEVYFSPQEDVIGRIYEEVRKAHTSVHFQIFAFTKDELGSLFVNKHREFSKQNDQLAEDGELPEDWRESMSPRDWPKKVTGVLDRSQLHGNGQYHEGYRLNAFGVPMMLDANENSRLPGDYQAGGGRLHTKTMILDAGTEDARVLTGSFNWSSSATVANDEVMLVLRGEEITNQYMDMFDELWGTSKTLATSLCHYMRQKDMSCSNEVNPGDVLISEVHWDGWNGKTDPASHTGDPDERPAVANDEFVELYNTTDRAINLSMWTLTNGSDFKVGFKPGTVIMPGEHYLVLDHNVVPYSEQDPQRGETAFRNPDFVLNTANDPRFPRLNLKNASLFLDIRDATGQVIDEAGDNGPPFFGGRVIESDQGGAWVVRNQSMERKITDGEAGDGTVRESWKACSLQNEDGDFVGGNNVNPGFRDKIIATPGEPNSQ